MIVDDNAGQAFIREVDDEYRRDRLGATWRRYGRAVLVALGVVLIAAAALLYWRKWQGDQADARAARYSQALSEVRGGQSAKATPTLAELARSPQSGYRALATLEQAGIVAATDPTKAASMYRAIAANDDLARPFRDLATLKAVQIEFDTIQPAQAIDRLRPLAMQGGPWFGTAGELTAIAYLREGKADLARPILAAIVKDESVPGSIRARASQLLPSLSPTTTAKGATAR